MFSLAWWRPTHRGRTDDGRVRRPKRRGRVARRIRFPQIWIPFVKRVQHSNDSVNIKYINWPNRVFYFTLSHPLRNANRHNENKHVIRFTRRKISTRPNSTRKTWNCSLIYSLRRSSDQLTTVALPRIASFWLKQHVVHTPLRSRKIRSITLFSWPFRLGS